MTFVETGGRRELWLANTLQAAFLDWLLLPETSAQLDALLTAVTDDAVEETPKPRDEILPIAPPTEVVPEAPSTAPTLEPTKPPTSNVVPTPSVESIVSGGEVPRFWFPSAFRRIPTIDQSWNSAVETRLLEAFGATAITPDLKVDFPTFETAIVHDVLHLSRYMASCVFCAVKNLTLDEWLTKVMAIVSKAAPSGSELSLEITWAELEEFWRSRLLTIDNELWNFYAVVKEEDNDFIWGHNFHPFLTELLERHPGVEFLKPTPEFQKRYIDAVTAKILYDLDALHDHKITFTQVAKSCLPECWRSVDEESDFNLIRDYFSYEHFYVSYCRFWALDSDHDFRLEKQDVVKYDNHAFSQLTLNRLFGESGGLISDGNTISYEGFCYLLMHDEDKTTDRSIEFWFQILDLDGDGVLRPQELAQFYSEQLVRLESRTLEAPAFEVILCQLNDMIRPDVSGEFRLRDLKRHRRHAALFFNTLLSLTKFLTWEHRDPFVQKTEFLEFPHYTEWDRFCHLEYERLSTEDLSEESSFQWDDLPGGFITGNEQEARWDSRENMTPSST